MIELRVLLLAGAALALPAAPALAAEDSPDAAAAGAADRALPVQLSTKEREDYRAVFASIRASEWSGAWQRLAEMKDGPLHDLATAELYLAPGSPRVELAPLLALLERAPQLPQAPQIARLAKLRGAERLPEMPVARNLTWVGGQPRRARPKSVAKSAVAAQLDALVQPLIVADRPADAERLLMERELEIEPEARTEFQQRIAWSYYLIGDDVSARRLAEQARRGSGEWVVQAHWVAGLAAWRMRDCADAASAFGTVGAQATDTELSAAGHYWAARAEMVCARPERVQGHLRTAARLGETFYGLLSASALGLRNPGTAALHDYRDAEWRSIGNRSNVKAAIAAMEIGERALADQLVTHEAKIGGVEDHNALLHLAADLDLAGTQYWLAHNAPRGARVNMSARYPAPEWRPVRGWRVDRSLAFAHVLQESNFRTQVVSPAGATGVMQLRPGTAGDMARSRGEAFDPRQLVEPSANLEFGQSYLEYLRDLQATGGLLPKVIAAYNAGSSPISEWNVRQRDQGDPLLYIESIPYWETRGYVPIVLRNYWVYEQQAGKDSVSRKALAQGLWPRFPGMPGASAVRLTAAGSPANTAGTD